MLRRENYSDADFSFLHLNIRSLPHNLVKLTDYLSCLNIKFSVIGISETWLNDSSHSVDISGIKFLLSFSNFFIDHLWRCTRSNENSSYGTTV